MRDPFLERMHRRFTLEHGLLAGGVIVLAGLVGGRRDRRRLDREGRRLARPGRGGPARGDVVVAGVQIFFASFVLSILGLRRPR